MTILRGLVLTAAVAAGTVMVPGVASADSFVNGSFETGNSSGWTVGGGYRASVGNSVLTPDSVLPGGSLYDASIVSHSSIIGTSYVDPNLGAALGSTVYSGNYSWRVEDTTSGGYASAIQQRVNNYTDANIFFAWKAVLENGGHTADQSASMIITLRDLTTNTDLVRRVYNAGATGTGVDTRFTSSGDLFYTPTWQIENIAIDASLAGHDFLLSVLGADCQPTGHTGYVYLDGFGAVIPPVTPGVPEPATWAMMLVGFGAMGATLRRRRAAKTAVSFG